jgi:hypothetical protein
MNDLHCWKEDTACFLFMFPSQELKKSNTALRSDISDKESNSKISFLTVTRNQNETYCFSFRLIIIKYKSKSNGIELKTNKTKSKAICSDLS